MKTNKLIPIITILFLAVFLASCTVNESSKTLGSNESTTNTNPSAIGPKIEEGQQIEVRYGNYNLSKSLLTPENCFDSDGGTVYSVKGYVRDEESKIFKDYCKNANDIVEYKCGVTGYREEFFDICVNGCDDGACIAKKFDADTGCVDSDAGPNDKFIKGNVTDAQGIIRDICSNKDILYEYKCNTVGFRMKQNIICPDGYGCSDGACIKD